MIQKPFRIVLVAKLNQHISQYSAGPFVVVPEGWDKPVSTQLIRFKGDIVSGRDYALGTLDAIQPDELKALHKVITAISEHWLCPICGH